MYFLVGLIQPCPVYDIITKVGYSIRTVRKGVCLPGVRVYSLVASMFQSALATGVRAFENLLLFGHILYW